VSARLGEATIVVKSGGRSWGGSQQRSEGESRGSYSTSWNNNDNWQQQARKLLKPEEVAALSPQTAITFAPGVAPICTRLVRYYEQRPDSFLKQQWRGVKACVYSLALLAAAIIFAKNVEMSYQYHLEHPRVRFVPIGDFRKEVRLEIR
jgi:type IV secretion system protein VirD4